MSQPVSNTSADIIIRRNRHRFRRKLLELNASRMLAFCVAYVLFQAVILVLAFNGFITFSFYSAIFMWMSMEMWLILMAIASGLGVIFSLLFVLILVGLIKGPNTQKALLHSCLILLTCMQVILCFYTSYNLVFFWLNFMIFAFLLGLFPVLPRGQSLSYILVFTLFVWVPYVFFHSFELGPIVMFSPIPLASYAAAWLSYGLAKTRIAYQIELEDREAALETTVGDMTAEYKEKARVAEAANLAKTRFLTRVSHEMRTSLTTILGMVHVAKETKEDKVREESLEAIDRASYKIREIVGSIIDTTKIELDFSSDELSQEFALIDADAATPEGYVEPVKTPDLAGKNILIVEDLDTNRFVLREYLRETNANIEEAINGKIAVEMFEASEPGYYCFVFMDLLMPEMNGHDATRAIRKLERQDAVDVPIVAVSANAFKADIEASLAAGMDAHLAKPVEQSVIFRTLNERLA